MVIKNGNEVKVKTKTGGEYKYKYTSLAQIQEELDKNEKKYSQEIITRENGTQFIKTTILDKDGKVERECIGCDVFIPEITGGNKMQAYGAGISYARRYSLLMAYGISTEDDDNENSYGDKAEKYFPKQPKQDTQEPQNEPPKEYITKGQLEIVNQKIEELKLTEKEVKDILKRNCKVEKLDNITKKQAELLIIFLDKKIEGASDGK